MLRFSRPAALGTMAVVAVLVVPGSASAAPPTCAGASLHTNTGQRLTLPANPCSDPDGDQYTVTPVSGPSHGTLSTDGTNNYYTPNPGYHGRDQFTYHATDTNAEVSNTATVNILVDTAPTCSDTSASVVSGQKLTITDLPCDDSDGDTLDILIGDPAHGTLDFAADGSSLTYTPAAGYTGPDAFGFFSEDPFGLDSADSTFNITVTAPPAPAPAPAPAPPVVVTPKDLTAPVFTLSAARKLKQAIAKGLAVKVATNEAGKAVVKLTVDKKSARRLGVNKKATGPVRVGTRIVSVPKGSSTVTVKLTPRARHALAHAHSVRMLITSSVTDAAGNTAVRTKSVTLK